MSSAIANSSTQTLYLAEGGTETEIMFKHGHEFPHFAVFELLKNKEAKAALTTMYQQYLDTVASSGFSALMAGLDYRASPDWAALLGYSSAGLIEIQGECIQFLRDVAGPYEGQIPEIKIAGIIGPRGDAYALNKTITAEEAEDYHSTQLQNLKDLNVPYAWAATFNNVPEAVGISRAAAAVGIPVCISFTLTSEHRLRSGPTLKQAVEQTDQLAGSDKPECYGINCSHPLEFEPALEAGDWFQRVRNLRPNAVSMDKVALCKLGHLEDGDPEDLGRLMGDLARRFPHVDMWGGCCGTWDTHLREIATNVAKAMQQPAA